jgi:Ca-activated chloride channel homolog
MRRASTPVGESTVGIQRRHLIYYLLLSPAICGLLYRAPALMHAQDSRVAIEPRAESGPATTGEADRIATRLRVDSNLVLIPVMVTDHRDRMITGLDRDHFRLYEDKVLQQITHFASEDAPVSIAVLFDCSGSMGPKLDRARAAVREFMRIANPEDEFALIPFADRAQLVSSFTSHSEDIQSQVMFLQARGRTALLDAIYMAMNEMKHAKHARKAILIISDGGDNASRYSARDIKKRVREADVQIYSIGILEPMVGRLRTREEMSGPALLDEVAHESGGRLFEVDNLNEMPDIASKIGMALRTQYILGYAPAIEKRDGKYHKVQVKVDRPKGVPPLRATFRPGYVAPGN